MFLMLALTLAAAGEQRTAPACRAADLAMAADGRQGDFNGMSHSGTRLTVRNLGRRTCVLPALPELRFLDAQARTLPTARNAPPGLHPGPAMVPLRLSPGGRATADLRWVSGEVYDRSRCVTAVRVALVAGGLVRAPLAAHLCGPAGKPVGVDQPALKPTRR